MKREVARPLNLEMSAGVAVRTEEFFGYGEQARTKSCMSRVSKNRAMRQTRRTEPLAGGEAAVPGEGWGVGGEGCELRDGHGPALLSRHRGQTRGQLNGQ